MCQVTSCTVPAGTGGSAASGARQPAPGAAARSGATASWPDSPAAGASIRMPAPCWVCVPGVIAIVMPAIRCPATVHHPDSGAVIVPTSSTALPPGASNGVCSPLDSRRSWRIVPPLTTRSIRCCPLVAVTVLGVMRISVSETVTVPGGPGAACGTDRVPLFA